MKHGVDGSSRLLQEKEVVGRFRKLLRRTVLSLLTILSVVTRCRFTREQIDEMINPSETAIIICLSVFILTNNDQVGFSSISQMRNFRTAGFLSLLTEYAIPMSYFMNIVRTFLDREPGT